MLLSKTLWPLLTTMASHMTKTGHIAAVLLPDRVAKIYCNKYDTHFTYRLGFDDAFVVGEPVTFRIQQDNNGRTYILNVQKDTRLPCPVLRVDFTNRVYFVITEKMPAKGPLFIQRNIYGIHHY